MPTCETLFALDPFDVHACIHLSLLSFSFLFVPPSDTCSLIRVTQLPAFACHVRKSGLLHHTPACLPLCTSVLSFKVVPTLPPFLTCPFPHLPYHTHARHTCTPIYIYEYTPALPHMSMYFSPVNYFPHTCPVNPFPSTPVLSIIFLLHTCPATYFFPLHLFGRTPVLLLPICSPPIISFTVT